MQNHQYNPNHPKSIHSHNRIIVTGASGVGKTTLVELLAPLLHLPIIPELARQLCAEAGCTYPGEIPDQEDFKRRVLDLQIAKELELRSFISDRSVIDAWVSWQRWNICSAMSYDTEAFYNKATEHVGRYTHLIYVPPMFAAPEDGFRWTDSDYQKQVDRLTRMTLYDWGLWERTYVVQSDEQESRAREVMEWLSGN